MPLLVQWCQTAWAVTPSLSAISCSVISGVSLMSRAAFAASILYGSPLPLGLGARIPPRSLASHEQSVFLQMSYRSATSSCVRPDWYALTTFFLKSNEYAFPMAASRAVCFQGS